jgi:GDPmannose 4,6-dehydratase
MSNSKGGTMKVAAVTGITGQDGAYLARNLVEKGYRVFGAYRRSSTTDFGRLKDLNVLGNPNLELVEHDLTDLSSSIRLLQTVKPHEVYNLAAQSFVGASFDQPNTTAQITGVGALNLLEAIRIVDPSLKFYQASTSEMFGLVQDDIQSEDTDFYPRSPYGVAKLFAHWMTINYRESYGIFGASGILFNHESPLRGKEFVTRKITDSVARISLGSEEVLHLGNLNALRDWGYADEYVEGMWRMLQADTPDTFVLATGKTTSVRDFVRLSFEAAGIDIEFEGSDDSECGRDKSSGRIVVQVDPKFYRPAEVHLLLGDASKAKKVLDWEAKVSVGELAKMMVEADIDRHKRG